MSTSAAQNTQPPALKPAADGRIESNSLADLLEWFLNYDERTARMRLPDVEQIFQWKQQDDAANGVAIYPFENAEARFAIGVFQALEENNTEQLLNNWITDVLNALHEARQSKAEISDAYKLDEIAELPSTEKAARMTTNAERRMYLTSCWIDALCTAEARFLGWVYQEIYGVPFSPAAEEPPQA